MLQRIFASSTFYEKETKRLDFVMIENDVDTFDKLLGTFFPVRFAKFLYVLKIPVGRKHFTKLINMQ